MTVRILTGDCRTTLASLDAESVQMCVTSPPYFGLRDYGHTGQIGLEPMPDAYVAELVAVFREVRRVLRDDGVLWLNLGDSYAAMRDSKATPDTLRGDSDGTAVAGASNRNPANLRAAGLKHKDLCGIPWRVAFALQADGWYLRSDIIWHKPNPMPESVTDRPTKSHEYLFLLAKSERYYYDADAIAEPATCRDARMVDGFVPKSDNGKWAGDAQATDKRSPMSGGVKYGDSDDAMYRTKSGNEYVYNGTRNRRTVWTVPTSSFKGAHFATFPPALIEPCILAGSAKECCAACGAPSVRQVERTAMVIDRSERTHDKGRTRASGTMVPPATSVTTGFAPSCSCNAGVVSGTVLDPFGGAGTTGLVADRLGRNAILCELNPDYAAMAERRIHGDAPLFAEVLP